MSQHFESLTQAGCTFERATTSATSSFTINGIPITSSTSEGVRYTWTLPTPAAFEAVFTPEKIGKKIVKIFKKELQVGDPVFDDAVYISTNDKEAAAKLLADERVRDTIHAVVVGGGRVAVEGDRVVYELVGEDSDEACQRMAALVGAFVA